jgi:ferredoxin--NADP+ reductase
VTRSIAIVGAGPAGLFTAQALRRSWPDAAIDIVERLPVPFGLIRYGVAPDHQGTKAITRQFDRLFEREGVEFLGGIEVGKDVDLEKLRDLYDVVVLATGLWGDRKLGIPGESLERVYGSGMIARWFNSYPEAACVPTIQFGGSIVIIGNGNVAIDLARLFAKGPQDFDGSDLCPECLESLRAQRISSIDVVGRSGVGEARFDAALLKEFDKIADLRVEAYYGRATDTERSIVERREVLDALVRQTSQKAPERTLRFRFDLTPIAIQGDTVVRNIAFMSNAGDKIELQASSVVTAIGFEAVSNAGIQRTAFASNDDPLPFQIAPGLFSVGWVRRGPRGTIPENRQEAKVAAGVITKGDATSGKAGRTALISYLRSRGVEPVSYQAWLAIRNAEEGAAPPGRVRRKISDVLELFAKARNVA